MKKIYCNFHDKFIWSKDFIKCKISTQYKFIYACRFHTVYNEWFPNQYPFNGDFFPNKVLLNSHPRKEEILMEIKSIEVDKEVFIAWLNDETPKVNTLYVDAYNAELARQKEANEPDDQVKANKAGLNALVPRINELEHLQFENRSRQQAVERFIKEKMGTLDKATRDKLITIPDYKVNSESRKAPKKETKSEKTQNAMASISVDKLQALRDKLAAKLANK